MIISNPIAGPASAALEQLTPTQVTFLQKLPKAELHAHLNGSIPLSLLQTLASEYLSQASHDSYSSLNESIKSSLTQLSQPGGPTLTEIYDFFNLFPAIYTITSTPDAVRRVTNAVLQIFLDGETPQCTYLELRTTPRASDSMTREAYLRVVLEVVESYPASQVGLIVSLDRKMAQEALEDCLAAVIKLRSEKRRIVGIDLCGYPTSGDLEMFRPYFAQAKKLGLGLTVHIAETTDNTAEDTRQLLSFNPDRLGHATFLNEEAISIVLEKKMCVEICLSSNLLCKTVSNLEFHHISQYLRSNHPIAICTDDILPFRTSLLGEYALLLAPAPYGLGLTEDQVRRVGELSLASSFRERAPGNH
ncbi:hypothetical protein CVT24_010834 [Panaeolus cyanescens]|uniref:Adenosine deaminase domain-containing protein n=1 Tax=Panaeolus cyanescens TaxID=181874 RepID=A0A409YYC9_9AGAR|nr:hypothetical protein CVT24_010834 [Panaeolus cyanescens]